MQSGGVFAEDDHLELVQGEILIMPPQGPEHGTLKDELHERLIDAYRVSGNHVLNQRPVVAGPRGMPEPELAVVRGRPRHYLRRHPGGRDLILVVELAKTSQDRDRRKLADYAAGDTPVVWLLDLDARTLEVHSGPDTAKAAFTHVATLTDADEVDLPELGTRLRVASLLP